MATNCTHRGIFPLGVMTLYIWWIMARSLSGYFVKNIGANRGKPRIWLEDLEVSSAKLAPGDRYDILVRGGTVQMKVNPNGARVVSRKSNKSGRVFPVIDINSAELLGLFEGMSAIRIVQREGEIHLLPLATEIRKKERLQRIKHKVLLGQPLAIGSVSHGAGLASTAVREGLTEAGLLSEKQFANEIRGELLNHAATLPSWDSSVVPVAAPMQEFAFDEAAMRHMPRLDIAELGLPCSGASKSGRAKRGTAKPEDHPEVGHLVVPGLMIALRSNAAVLLFENVIPYANSASASIIRGVLKDAGYSIHETVLRGQDFNALEHRDRWVMVAVTEGMHFSWDMLQLPQKRDLFLSEVLDDIPDDDPCWSEMAGLKAKQGRDLAKGNNFTMHVADPSSTRVGTLGKGYAKVRATETKIAHPSNPDLLRQLTPAEHARVKQWPPSIVDGLSATIAHEALGQAVLRDPFRALGKAVGDSVMTYAKGLDITDASELASVIAAEVTDTASVLVQELRSPLAGVIYEGPISSNDLGMVIQDVGNGVGILHRSTSMPNTVIGEIVRVKYWRTTAAPEIEHLSKAAPARTPELSHAMLAYQQSLFDEPSTLRPPSGPRL